MPTKYKIRGGMKDLRPKMNNEGDPECGRYECPAYKESYRLAACVAGCGRTGYTFYQDMRIPCYPCLKWQRDTAEANLMIEKALVAANQNSIDFHIRENTKLKKESDQLWYKLEKMLKRK